MKICDKLGGAQASGFIGVERIFTPSTSAAIEPWLVKTYEDREDMVGELVASQYAEVLLPNTVKVVGTTLKLEAGSRGNKTQQKTLATKLALNIVPQLSEDDIGDGKTQLPPGKKVEGLVEGLFVSLLLGHQDLKEGNFVIEYRDKVPHFVPIDWDTLSIDGTFLLKSYIPAIVECIKKDDVDKIRKILSLRSLTSDIRIIKTEITELRNYIEENPQALDCSLKQHRLTTLEHNPFMLASSRIYVSAEVMMGLADNRHEIKTGLDSNLLNALGEFSDIEILQSLQKVCSRVDGLKSLEIAEPKTGDKQKFYNDAVSLLKSVKVALESKRTTKSSSRVLPNVSCFPKKPETLAEDTIQPLHRTGDARLVNLPPSNLPSPSASPSASPSPSPQIKSATSVLFSIKEQKITIGDKKHELRTMDLQYTDGGAVVYPDEVSIRNALKDVIIIAIRESGINKKDFEEMIKHSTERDVFARGKPDTWRIFDNIIKEKNQSIGIYTGTPTDRRFDLPPLETSLTLRIAGSLIAKPSTIQQNDWSEKSYKKAQERILIKSDRVADVVGQLQSQVR